MPTAVSFERHPVDPARLDDYTPLLVRLLERTREAPGSLWADAAQAMDDDPSFVVLSEWRTEADLDAWESSDELARLRDDAAVLLRGEATRRRFLSA